ncbi:hypothetical protein LEP1GSC127_3762 [Leptospira kirschneri str. 200801925]|nr:hypothetical protein LEP1GSC127_3762 [Leptospira kirschneri str. 200801925]
MGKNNSFRPKNSFLKFQVVFGFFLLSFVSLNSEEKSSILDPTFFLIHKNLNPSLGGLFETRKNLLLMEPGLNFRFGNGNVNIFGKPIFSIRITKLFQSFIKLT